MNFMFGYNHEIIGKCILGFNFDEFKNQIENSSKIIGEYQQMIFRFESDPTKIVKDDFSNYRLYTFCEFPCKISYRKNEIKII
jgi:hypothetical protein